MKNYGMWKKLIVLMMSAGLWMSCGGDNAGTTSGGADVTNAPQDVQDSSGADVLDAGLPPADTSPRGPDAPDAQWSDTSAPADAGPDATSNPKQPRTRTLSDYRRCTGDSDCPVGLGSCVKQVALNRADYDGTQEVALRDIFAGLGQDEGICTFVCTNSPGVCASLSVNGATPDAQAHECQLVVQGAAPYPEVAPAFPFGAALDVDSQTWGQPFGAICRPPFGLHEDVADSMCQACEGPDSCGEGAGCFSLLHGAPAQQGEAGTCLSACSADGGCALGFVCDAVSADNAQGYCRPLLATCSACRDLDGDGFGTGRCGSADKPVTPHDCDDRDPRAYFDPDDMDHPFPTYCGVHDFNCNGLSDAVEQIGSPEYGAMHCTACNDACEGDVPHGTRLCRNLGTLSDPQSACMAQCVGNFADCDGQVANGCEVEKDSASRQYYRDRDGDGYGDPNDAVFECGEDDAPPG